MLLWYPTGHIGSDAIIVIVGAILLAIIGIMIELTVFNDSFTVHLL